MESQPETSKRRGRPHALTLEQVIAEAIALANEEGLQNISFRALGARLGVAATTVSRTVGDLEALQKELVKKVVDDATLEMTWPDDWQGIVWTFARTAATVLFYSPLTLEAHTRRAPLVSSTSDAIVSRVVRALEAAGLPSNEAMYTFFIVYDFVVGHIAVRVGRGNDPDGRPERHQLVEDILGTHNYNDRFALGMTTLIAGIETRLERHATKHSMMQPEKEDRPDVSSESTSSPD